MIHLQKSRDKETAGGEPSFRGSQTGTIRQHSHTTTTPRARVVVFALIQCLSHIRATTTAIMVTHTILRENLVPTIKT